MDTVYFITPEGKRYRLKYAEVEEFCKAICLKEENKESFREFQKDYTYFSPYFDFIVFKLEYLFSPQYPYCLGKYQDALYKNFIFQRERYKEFLLRIEKQSETIMPWMTKCSDSELRIQKFASARIKESMIDANAREMMSYSGTVCGSHITTANTIMNQLLIKDAFIGKDFKDFEEKVEENKALNYLIKRMGFLQVTGEDISYIFYNSSITTNEQHSVIEYCENHNFEFLTIDEDEEHNYTSYYQKLLKK